MESSEATPEAVPYNEDERKLAEKQRRAEIAHRFGRAVKRLREASKISGSDLAQRLGYTNAALWNIENEQTDGPPQLDRVLAVLDAFGVSQALFWTLLEGPVRVPARPGADPETEQRLNLQEALGEQLVEMARDLRRRVQGPPAEDESPPVA